MRTAIRAAVVSLAVLVLAYLVDAVWVRIRVATHHDPTRTVDVTLTLTVPQKNGRLGLFPGGVETRSCVRALFPQLGLPPCWYLERHTEQRVDY
jgi:hypothetical protein